MEQPDPIQMKREDLTIEGNRKLYSYTFTFDRDDAAKDDEALTPKMPENKE